MALLIRGKSRCCLCDSVIEEGDEVVTFPSGLFSRREEAFKVNDAAVHAACLDAASFGSAAKARLQEFLRRS